MSKISVIVPVYRVEKYLDRCVESVLNQSFSDFELILVDDGSPDDCPRLCDEWAKKDARIRVIHKPNGGLSDARNAGLDTMTGEFVTFLDSDDYLHSRMLETLLSGIAAHGTAVSLCKFKKTDGEPLDETAPIPEPELWETERYYLHDSMNATVACAKLYRKDCFDSIRYPLGKLHEDEFTTYRILFQYPTISAVKHPLYGYYRNTDGITRSLWNPRRMMIFDAYEEQLQFFRQENRPAVIKDRYHNYLWAITSQMEQMTALGETTHLRQTRKRLKQVVKHYRTECSLPFAACAGYYEKIWPMLKKPIRLMARLTK